jgi:aminoglycoside phosphotransferase (APT) family kinase protein
MAELWDPQEVVTGKLARQLIEEQFPQLKPVAVKTLGEGFDNTVFHVNGSYVFRFPRREVAVELLGTENRLLPALANKLPISIPNPTYIGVPGERYPWTFTGYPIVPGKTPGLLSSEKRLQSVRLLAGFLRELHSFSVKEATKLKVPYDKINRLDVTERRPKLKDHLRKAFALGLLSNDKKLDQFIESVTPNSEPRRLSLVHGDLHIRNLLVDDEGTVSGIIDWGDTHIGHPAIDLSIVYTFLPPEGRDSFYTIYGEVDEQTKKLAIFKAIYTTTLLLLYAHDTNDSLLMEECNEVIRQLL